MATTEKKTIAKKAAPKKTADKDVIVIKPLVIKTATIRLVGDTPMIVHRWSEKMKRLLPAGKRAAELDGIDVKKEYQSPIEAFIESCYWISGKPTEYTQEAFEEAIANGARFGMRVEAFKMAAIDAAYSKGWLKNKKSIKGLFFIRPDAVDEEGNQLVEIHSDPPVMREDIVILSGISRTPDLRWRPEFRNWYVDLKIEYDADGMYSLQDIVTMLQAGGRYNGIAEYRPEKDGQFGMFSVESSVDD